MRIHDLSMPVWEGAAYGEILLFTNSPVRFVGPEGALADDAPEALASRAVGVQRGTVNQTFMERHYPATSLRLYENQEHVLLDLTLGRLDAVLGEAAQLDAGFLRTEAGRGFAFFGDAHFDPSLSPEDRAVGRSSKMIIDATKYNARDYPTPCVPKGDVLAAVERNWSDYGIKRR